MCFKPKAGTRNLTRTNTRTGTEYLKLGRAPKIRQREEPQRAGTRRLRLRAAGKSRHVSVRGSRTEAKLNHSPEADHALSKPCAAAAVSLRPPAGSGVSPLLHRLPGQLQAPPRDPAHPAPDPRSRLRHAQSRPRGNGARLVFLRLAGKPPTRPLRMFVSVSTTETSFSIPVATMTPLELPRGARSNLFTPRLPLPRPPATYACFSPEKIWVFLA